MVVLIQVRPAPVEPLQTLWAEVPVDWTVVHQYEVIEVTEAITAIEVAEQA